MSFYALLKHWGVTFGDEVALTGFTCAVMVNAVLRVGAKPVFIDIDKDTLGMSPVSLSDRISKRTKVIVAQHSFGIPCKIDEIKEISQKHGCYLVEDCALTFGSKYKHTMLGNYGDAAIFSTDHTKPLNTLVGGFVYTQRLDIANSVREFQNTCAHLSKEHQYLILKTYIKEQHIEAHNHKLYILQNYWNAVKSRLGIKQATTPYLQNEASSTISESSFYPYPSTFPSFLAKIGLNVFKQYEESLETRNKWMQTLVTYLKDREELPGAYFDSNSEIVPLRIAFESNKSTNKFGYIDDWVWFKQPIVATTEDLKNFGYEMGTCPISEQIGSKIMNLPILLDKKDQDRFLKYLNKTYSYGI